MTGTLRLEANTLSSVTRFQFVAFASRVITPTCQAWSKIEGKFGCDQSVIKCTLLGKGISFPPISRNPFYEFPSELTTGSYSKRATNGSWVSVTGLRKRALYLEREVHFLLYLTFISRRIHKLPSRPFPLMPQKPSNFSSNRSMTKLKNKVYLLVSPFLFHSSCANVTTSKFYASAIKDVI
jgi:hypothetical protein